MGSFDNDGEYTPREITENDLGSLSLDDAYTATMVDIENGQMVEGTVVRIDKDEVLLDIGYKSEGVIPQKELSIRNNLHPNEVLEMGEKVEALVLQREDAEGRLLLSRKRALYEKAWGDIEAVKEADGMVSGTVIEVVKGGLIVDIGLRGFLPASLVDLRRVRDLQPLIGTTVDTKIIELDRNRNNVVLSRRAWLEESQKDEREDFLTNLKSGEVRSGVVSSVVNFGAFVDLGPADGLIPISEISWSVLNSVDDAVSTGDTIDVLVLNVDHAKQKITLSLKRTMPEPWETVHERYLEGQIVEGKFDKVIKWLAKKLDIAHSAAQKLVVKAQEKGIDPHKLQQKWAILSPTLLRLVSEYTPKEQKPQGD